MDKYIDKVKEQHPSLFEHVLTEQEVEWLNEDEVIAQICGHHPGEGTGIGYSWYVGGMADTGEWIVRRMKLVHISHLKKFLNELNRSKEVSNQYNIQNLAEIYRIDDLPEPERTEIRNQKWKDNIEEQRNAMIKISRDIENKLMWGDIKPTDKN